MDCIGRDRIGILFQINRFPGTKTPHKQESVLFPGTAPAKDRRLKQKNESEEINP